ncbi:unnamed protein product [Notodromas monacha]|uniref:Uncharacterized protein n=1 Tax=Notodromas monacha TaxID=399045 RepID=A0A7R9GA27_9CRUS|nr:unnamed protein product [Notodromas monacha]CAG0913246.1 unnamed protein product [Notodromas monacha]
MRWYGKTVCVRCLFGCKRCGKLTQKRSLSSSHSIEGVRTLFMMHEAMSELRNEMLKKDQELLALRRDLQKERVRGDHLASKMGSLQQAVNPNGNYGVERVSQMDGPSYRHSCMALFDLDASESSGDSDVMSGAFHDDDRKCIKKGVWDVAAFSRMLLTGGESHSFRSSLPNIPRTTTDDEDEHSTCSTTSLLAAAESFNAMSNWGSKKIRNKKLPPPFSTHRRSVVESKPNSSYNVPEKNRGAPCMPRRFEDVVMGSRVKYFHPNGRVFAGTVMQKGGRNGLRDDYVWCTCDRGVHSRNFKSEVLLVNADTQPKRLFIHVKKVMMTVLAFEKMASVIETSLNDLDFAKCIRDELKLLDDRKKLSVCGEHFGISQRNAFWYDPILRHVHLLKEPHTEGKIEKIVLVPQDPPLFDVSSIKFSPKGSFIALVGRQGISVLVSPAVVSPVPEKVLCRTVKIAQHLLLTNPKLEVVEAKFHPGSPTDSHIVVLCSDNYLRIFEMNDGLTPEQVIPLGRSCATMLSSLSMTSMQASLGEIGMAFDFAPPLLREESQNGPKNVSAVQSTASDFASSFVWWPIFVLRGDCEVLYLLSAVGSKRPRRTMVQCPISVRPDIRNYSVESTNILCLQSNPPILIIITAEGQLIHAVVLPAQGAPDIVEPEDPSDLMAQLSVSDVDRGVAPMAENFQVGAQIIEVIELDVPLQDEETAKSGAKSSWCPHSGTIYGSQFWNSHLVSLRSDDFAKDRYYVTHATGIHSVRLPSLRQFREFVADPEINVEFSGDVVESEVEQLICTRLSFPNKDWRAEPIAGFGILPPYIFVLLPPADGYKMCVQRYGPVWRFSSDEAVSSTRKADGERIIDKRFSDSFIDHIGNILKRDRSLPMMRISGGIGDPKQLNDMDTWNFLRMSTQLLREQYFIKFDLACAEMANRHKSLRGVLDTTKSHVTGLSKDLMEIQERNDSLLERGAKLVDQQSELLCRVERCCEKLMKKVPVITVAEKKMLRELENMESGLREYEEQLAFIRRVMTEVEGKRVEKLAIPLSQPAMQRAKMAELSSTLKTTSEWLLQLTNATTRLVSRVSNLHGVM